jgi:hypothetical protein
MAVGKKLASILIVLSLSLFGLVFGGTVDVQSGPSEEEPAAYDPVIASIVANVSKSQLTDYIWDLQNFTTRYPYTDNLNWSATYILEELGSNPNVANESQYFVYSSRTYRNVLGTLPAFNPNNKTVYIVSGHYDSYSNSDPENDAPGADDDASGTAVAMEACRVLSEYKLNATVICAGWTAEEIGLVGSEYYAKDAKEKGMDIGMVLQFDMVGYDPSGLLGLDIIADFPSAWILNEFIEAETDYSIGLDLTDYINPGAGRSDHASFWGQGYPAMMGIESVFNTPNYHTVQDTIDKLNMDLVHRTTQAAVAVLAKIAGILTPGDGVIHFNKTSYMLTDQIGVTLYDTDLNVNPAVQDFVDVVVNSTSESGGEIVPLVETGPDTNIFAGGIAATPIPGVIDELTIAHGDKITATYVEASPAGLRHAYATADGLPPVIRNVAATPDVTSAVITWDTDEVADSQVSYGLTPALGSGESDNDFTKQHSITLNGLTPDTRYYFEVASRDIAGNRAVDDNSGMKYSFVTLSGYTKIPGFGYVGWVRDEEPTGNHFDDPQIIVGHSNRRWPTYDVDYLGAAQFPADPLPMGATITKATVEFYGDQWIYTDVLGQWSLKLLDASIDPGWTMHAFPDIEGAVDEATILPIVTNQDLAEMQWNTFEFTPAQFALLESHMANGMISFRIEGPRSPAITDGLIFAWRSGYEGTSFATPYAPKLTVKISMTGDSIGPVVTTVDVSPSPTEGAPFTGLTATVSDEATGMSNIHAAEYFVDADPGIGEGIPMTAVDGSLDSVIEDVDYSIEVSGLSEGLHMLYVRGMDSAGNWGSPASVQLMVTSGDTTPPLPVSDVTGSLEGGSLQDLGVTWTLSPDDATDVANYALYRGTVYDTDGLGYEFLASLPPGTSGYVDPGVGYGDPSDYFYFVCANDSEGNCGGSESQGGKIIVNLSPGEQLISVPLYQTDVEFWKDVTTASYSSIRAYDPTFTGAGWRSFSTFRNVDTLSTVDHTIGMWVTITSNSDLTFAGSVLPQFTIQLGTGWNLVGFPSPVSRMASDALAGVPFVSIEGFDITAPPHFLREYASNELLEPGRGYWVEVTSDTAWVIQN